MSDDERLLIRYIYKIALATIGLVTLLAIVTCLTMAMQTRHMINTIYNYDYPVAISNDNNMEVH